MSLFMNSPQEETFRSLMDFFNGRRSRVLVSNQPYLIRAEIGAYWSMSRGNAKGEVEASITKRNGGSYVNLNFNFMKEYILGLVAASIGAIIAYVLVYAVANAMITSLRITEAGIWMWINGVTIFGIVTIFLSVMVLEGQNAEMTKKRFLDELNTFARSLPPPPEA